jgi:hypothetical protein
MDPLDIAADRSLTYQSPELAHSEQRPLRPDELRLLVNRLEGTDQPISAAVRSLRMPGVEMLSIDDIEALEPLIIRCQECDIWTRPDKLSDGVCQPCRREDEQNSDF